jgi:hypothetical protein
VEEAAMTNRTVLALAFALTLCAGAPTARAVEGDWFTDADEALAAAAKSKRPILAVAMDHG